MEMTTEYTTLITKRLNIPGQSTQQSLADITPDPSLHQRFGNAVAALSPIKLREIDQVTLQDRAETKFIMSASQMLAILPLVNKVYSILSIRGQRLNRYRTLYFDTPSFDFYTRHVNGNAERYKVRSREYRETKDSFLEVKLKNRKERTIKQRIPTDVQMMLLNTGAKDWVQNRIPFDAGSLEPRMLNTYTRLTLVNIPACERVTIDFDISFSWDNREVNLGKLVVAEAKTGSSGNSSPFLRLMHQQGIRSTGFSKYCIGVSQLYDNVKKNALKPKLLKISKINAGAL